MKPLPHDQIAQVGEKMRDTQTERAKREQGERSRERTSQRHSHEKRGKQRDPTPTMAQQWTDEGPHEAEHLRPQAIQRGQRSEYDRIERAHGARSAPPLPAHEGRERARKQQRDELRANT